MVMVSDRRGLRAYLGFGGEGEARGRGARATLPKGASGNARASRSVRGLLERKRLCREYPACVSFLVAVWQSRFLDSSSPR
jgi:hypothetical protein